MRRAKKWILWGIVIAVAAGVVFWALQPDVVEIEMVEIQRGPMSVTVAEEGITRVKDRYVVSSNVGGLLGRIELKPGDRIKQGQSLLATIQPSDPTLLDAREVSLATTAVASAKVAIERALARRQQAQVAADLAESAFGRANQLMASKSISKEEFDLASAAFRSRQEDLRVANFEQEIAQFELQQAEAALEHFTADRNAPDSVFEIRSPIDGLVLRVFQESSTVVTPGLRIMEVGNPTDLELVVDVLSSSAVQIAPGDAAELHQWGGEGVLKGVVRVVEPAATTVVSTLGVEEQRVNVVVDFIEPPASMSRLGDAYAGEAWIVIWSSEDELQVPTSALFREGGDWHAFEVVDGFARQVKLEIGQRNATVAQLLSGLEAGAQVIAYPNDMIRDGVQVQAKNGK